MAATVTDLPATKARIRLAAERMMRLRVAMKDLERDDLGCENFSFDDWRSCAAAVVCRRQEFIDDGLTMNDWRGRPTYREDGVLYVGFGALQRFFDLTPDQSLTLFAGPTRRMTMTTHPYPQSGKSVDESPHPADHRRGRGAVTAMIDRIDAHIGRPLPEAFAKVLAGG